LTPFEVKVVLCPVLLVPVMILLAWIKLEHK
jgi:hypothetical protein